MRILIDMNLSPEWVNEFRFYDIGTILSFPQQRKQLRIRKGMNACHKNLQNEFTNNLLTKEIIAC